MSMQFQSCLFFLVFFVALLLFLNRKQETVWKKLLHCFQIQKMVASLEPQTTQGMGLKTPKTNLPREVGALREAPRNGDTLMKPRDVHALDQLQVGNFLAAVAGAGRCLVALSTPKTWHRVSWLGISIRCWEILPKWLDGSGEGNLTGVGFCGGGSWLFGWASYSKKAWWKQPRGMILKVHNLVCF